MSDKSSAPEFPSDRQVRLWPAVCILALQAIALVLTVTPQINNVTRFGYMMLGPAVCVLLFAIWLLFASRLRWTERVTVAAGAIALGVVAGLIVDLSMRTTLWIYGAPLAMLLIVVGLRIGRAWTPAARTRFVVALAACGWLLFALGRLEGFDGSYWPEFGWRWQASHEERLVATERVTTGKVVPAAIEMAHSDWPGFRGVGRNSRVWGPVIRTDWENALPAERWRIAVGPAWSSLAHVAGRLFTQEQRGEEEIVVCYDAETGVEIWRHAQQTRFADIVSGAGPRATPTYSDGRLYTMGAKGVLNCLDAATGDLIWQRDLMQEVGAKLPVWGFSGSPLVTHGRVIVYAGGKNDRGLVAYEASTGEPAWHVAGSGMNFSSAQLEQLDGVDVVLFANEQGLVGIEPASGDVLWTFSPSGWKGPPMVQPQAVGPTSVILPLGDGIGVARIDIHREGQEWLLTESWSSRQLKPAFNDFVHHEGFLYGFDQSIFTCLDAETGKRRWKGGRYGFGQVLLLEAASVLLVLSESGEAILLAADPTQHRELGRFQAISGKTWNHPIVVGDKLFVRNGEEMACFELAAATES